jgi:hypothetical protein
MRSLNACVVGLLFVGLASSVFADVILKDGKIVAIGRDAKLVGEQIEITDCKHTVTSKYDRHQYEFKKGENCRAYPPAAAPPPPGDQSPSPSQPPK